MKLCFNTLLDSNSNTHYCLFQANLYDSKSNCSSFVAQGSYTKQKHGLVVLLGMVGLEVCCQAVGYPPGEFPTNIIVIDGPWGRELAAKTECV